MNFGLCKSGNGCATPGACAERAATACEFAAVDSMAAPLDAMTRSEDMHAAERAVVWRKGSATEKTTVAMTLPPEGMLWRRKPGANRPELVTLEEARALDEAKSMVFTGAATLGGINYKAEYERLHALVNNPQTAEFLSAVKAEAAHQRERWGDAHDRGKSAENWFWLVGYLAGKCLRAVITGDKPKALHHTISAGAALANWYEAIKRDETGCGIGHDNDIRPVELARFEDGAKD